MDAQNLTFTASEQTLTNTGGAGSYSSNIVSYLTATFTLGDNWSGYDSVSAVWKSDHYQIETVLDANGECTVPPEVLYYKSKVYVNLVGVTISGDEVTNRMTSYKVLAFTIDAESDIDGEETAAITPSQFQQFVSDVSGYSTTAASSAEDSEAWAVGERNGEAVTSGDDTYQNNSKYYATQAANSATTAQNYACGEAIADTYDATATYAVGDYVMYLGDLYCCNTAITTAEAWDSTHWTQETVGENLSSLKDDIGYVITESFLTMTWGQGYINNSNGTIGVDASACYTTNKVAPGSYELKLADGYKSKVARFSDANVFQGVLIPLSAGDQTFEIESGYFARIQVTNTNGTLTPADVDDTIITLSTKPYVEENALDLRLTTTESILGLKSNGTITEIVTPSMSVSDFRTAFNNELSSNYITLTGSSIYSFNDYSVADTTWASIYAKVNKIFRANVYYDGMPHETFCERVNKAFTENIWMWKDAKYNDGTARDFSLAFSERSGEPSAIVSPDGGTLYVYGYNGRWSTKDGIHWSEKESLNRTGAPNNSTPEHSNTNYLDGIYYMVGALNNTDRDLALFTSTDGINFTYQGMPLEKTDITVDGETVQTWGNSYIVKDADTYYLYIEAKLTNNANFWDIYLCTCTDPLVDNGDGTVGNWTYNNDGAVVTDDFSSQDLRAHGNPDFAKGPDNKPIRINGNWYMYYHVTYNGRMYIYRAYSPDLKNWTVEGRILNNRDVPTDGEGSAGNADHALIEFKGKTYLFYTWDINSVNTPYIKYVIDDRPFRELLTMYP